MGTQTDLTLDSNQKASVYIDKFRHLPAVDEASSIGEYDAEIVGSGFVKAMSKLMLPLIGFSNWKGKRLLGKGKGINTFIKNGQAVDDIPMKVTATHSWLDEKPALVLTYLPSAPFLARYLRDELRQLDSNTIILVGWFDLPFMRNSPSPMLLRKSTSQGAE